MNICATVRIAFRRTAYYWAGFALGLILLAMSILLWPADAGAVTRLNLGGFAVVTPSGDVPLGYLTADVNRLKPLTENNVLIYGVGIGVSPAGNWGGYTYAIVERTALPWLGLDLVGLVSHDRDPVLRDHTVYVGGGPGFTLLFGDATISASTPIMANLEGFGWAANPSLTVGFPLCR